MLVLFELGRQVPVLQAIVRADMEFPKAIEALNLKCRMKYHAKSAQGTLFDQTLVLGRQF